MFFWQKGSKFLGAGTWAPGRADSGSGRLREAPRGPKTELLRPPTASGGPFWMISVILPKFRFCAGVKNARSDRTFFAIWVTFGCNFLGLKKGPPLPYGDPGHEPHLRGFWAPRWPKWPFWGLFGLLWARLGPPRGILGPRCGSKAPRGSPGRGPGSGCPFRTVRPAV